MFQPDVILPSQFFATLRRQAPGQNGECRLLVAVLEDAVLCFQKYALGKRPRQDRLFKEAQEWLMREDAVIGEDERPKVSFEYVCDILGLDADYLRRGLEHWQERQLAGASGGAPKR